jgi:CRP-like cAMP-binding protein
MISTFLSSFDIFTPSEIADFEEKTAFKLIKKGDFLIKEGQLCREVAFLKTGILRSFFSSESGEDITYCITFPNTLTTAYSSFITGLPTLENIQAISTAEVIVIQKAELDKLSQSSLNWTRFLKMIAEQQYLELENRLFLFQKEKAKKRYIDLLNNHPLYVQQIPLQYLASYLGITARHLSRLRREVVL